MKVIFRADDVGYTDVHNMGTWKTIEEGITTSCDFMLDCPGFFDACEHLKNYPWLSIGWHTHMWGRPVLDPSEVPSMVNEAGRFKWRTDKNAVMSVDFEEAYRECRAQILRCEEYLGRVPDTVTFSNKPDTPLNAAIKAVCDEFHIAYGFEQGKGYGDKEKVCKEEYKHLNIFEWAPRDSVNTRGLKVENFAYYHPDKVIMEMPIIDDRIYIRSEHPGYLDNYVLAESSCTIPRVRDVDAYTSPEVKQWIKDNHIELVNYRDALYGTHEYQNHLRAIGSDLLYKEKK